MAFLVADKLVFLHVPKTAGVWVKTVLPKAGVKLAGKLGKDHQVVTPPPGRRAFMFVRHPANWLKSMWMEMDAVGTGIENSPAGIFEEWYRKDECFCDFVERVLEEKTPPISLMFEEYERPCWMVARVEDLPEALCQILDAAGQPYKAHTIENWHRENVTDHALRERTRFGQHQRERLLAAESAFCKRWDYR